jgi:hypothetical protein
MSEDLHALPNVLEYSFSGLSKENGVVYSCCPPRLILLKLLGREMSLLETIRPLFFVVTNHFPMKHLTDHHCYPGSRCALYYDAMHYVFKQHKICVREIEIGFSARCTYLHMRKIYNCRQMQKTQHDYETALRALLNGTPMKELEPWVYEIWGIYLYGWLKEAKHIGDDFRHNFRRKVFLG